MIVKFLGSEKKMDNRVESKGLVMDGRTRALLKRNDPWEVRGAYEWVRRVKSLPAFSGVSDSILMNLTPVIAQVRADRAGSLGKVLRRTVSEIRMRRFLACQREDVAEHIGRLVQLLGRQVPIEDVIATVVFWGDARRRKLARDYFDLEADDGE